ncbi:MAG: DUF456 domain-containing protein [Tepidisphaeraceae bacterium]
MLVWVYYVLLLLALVAGWMINIFGLPGLWVMLLGHLAFAFATGWDHYVGWPSVITLFILALAAEVIEFIAGAAGSKKAGGTKRGATAAIVGGLVGGIVGSIIIPVPIAGTIIGAVAGSFIGAAVIERMIEPNSRRALKIGYGAAKGRLAGILIKSGIGIGMGLVSLAAALPIGGSSPAGPLPPAATLPAPPSTAPTTQR